MTREAAKHSLAAAAPKAPADVSSHVPAPLTLPQTLVGRADLSRLVREIEALDNELEAQKVRAHEGAAHLPALSRTLNDFAELNKLDLAKAATRDELRKQFRVMKDKAPSIHLTFASDPDAEFLHQLVGWIRKELSPMALIDIGLQPSLIGGVYVRTPNHVHDFSLRRLLADKRELLVKELEALGGQ